MSLINIPIVQTTYNKYVKHIKYWKSGPISNFSIPKYLKVYKYMSLSTKVLKTNVKQCKQYLLEKIKSEFPSK